MPTSPRRLPAVALVVASTVAAIALPRAGRAQMGDPSKVTLRTTPVAGNLSMIEGANGFAGGNVAVLVGDDGVFVVDDELHPLTIKLKAALAGLTKKPVKFVVNTHWHADHTGGNEGLGAAGAVIVAQDNVRKRLGVDQVRNFMGKEMTFPAQPAGALPVVTFAEDVTLHVNGDEIHVVHVPPAHTDGDAVVHFKKANVIHTGDTVTAGYPVVDVESGGTLEGFIVAADRILALADDATKIIPGHGPLMTKADVAAWRAMIVTARERVAKLEAGKKPLEDIKAAKPLADFDARWGQGFMKADDFVETIYKSHAAAAAAAPAAGVTRGAKRARK